MKILIATLVIKFNGWFNMPGMINTTVSLPKDLDDVYDTSLVVRSIVTFPSETGVDFTTRGHNLSIATLQG